MSFGIAGVVHDGGSGVRLTGATVKLVAAQNVLGAVGAAQPSEQPYTWSKVINGSDVGVFPNNRRYDCYAAFVQNVIAANVLSDRDFYDEVLVWNPQLGGDGNRFVAGKFYFIATTEGGQQFEMTTSSDGSGHFRFDGLEQAGVYGLIAVKDGYLPTKKGLQIFPPQIADQNPPPTIELGLGLTPTPNPPQQRIFSTEPGVAAMPQAVQRAVQQALLLITNDEKKAFDTLPPDLQKLAYGYGKPPGISFKDLVCADLPSICYAAALGHGPTWLSQGNCTGSHCANYYRPIPGVNDNSLQAISGRVGNLSVNDDWKPGDVIVYWPANSNSPAHVNLYVGRFQGVDLDGVNHPNGERYVLNTSQNIDDPSDKWGPKVAFFRLVDCVQGFGFATRQHVRISDLWR